MKAIGGIRAYAAYGLTVAAVWLGWEIIKAPIAERSPPSLAMRTAPGSPQVLRRAAEAELAAGRTENAASLAEASLVKAPFNARALRVLGLATAGEGAASKADAMLTLAGNWSLRDDPAHAWLIERRLRQGNYDSAFAHADTLARRWKDGNERIYNLFTTAILADRRAIPAVAAAMARKPPWRPTYIQYLIKRPDGDAVLLALGLALSKNPNGYDDTELGWIYQSWYWESRFEAIRSLRAGVGRPDRLDDLQNGDFTTPAEETIFPFGWRLDPASGFSAAVMEDEKRADGVALRVEYDGFASGVVTEQILMLSPGARLLTGQERVETSPNTSRLRWRITCVENGQVLATLPVAPAHSGAAMWRSIRLAFIVPPSRCRIQRLRLETNPGDRRATTVAWFDGLKIVPASAAESSS